MGSDRYCLRWNNHQNNLLGVFSQLLQEESLVDVTLACSEGHSIRAHKVVLSACSSYFQSLFVDHPSRHPIVILKDVCFAELRTLVEFMYRGEVNLEYCQLPTFLKTAESLQVKGLAEMTHLRSSLSPEKDMDTAVLQQQQQQQSPSPPPHLHDDLPASVITTTPNVVANNVHEPLSLIRRRSRSPLDISDLPGRVAPVDQPLSPSSNRQFSPNGANETSPPPTASSALESPSVSRSPSSRMPSSVSPHPPDTSSVCDDQRSMSPDPDDDSSIQSGPSDMTVNSQMPSPSLKIIPGPSTLPPMQKQPLSLAIKSKNSNWDNNEEKSPSGNNGSDYSITRHLPDTGLSSPLDALYHRLPLPPGFLLPSSSSSAAVTLNLSSDSSSPSVDQLSSSSRSSTPFFIPFPSLPVLPPSFLPGGESSLSWYSFLQSQNIFNAPTKGYPSPGDLSQRNFIKCAICLAAFPSSWLLEQHTMLQHSGQSVRRPNPSSESGSSSREEKPFQCDQCGQSYRYRSAYIKHKEQNHRARLPADKLFTCDICGMQFRYLKSFKKHRVNHTLEMFQHSGNLTHNKKEGKQSASESSKSVGSADQPTGVVSESQVSSSNEVEPQSTATATNKEENADSVSLTNSEPNLFNLLRYPPERTRERQLFACSYCSKTVRSKENLKLHVRKHTGERPFACLFCGRAFGGKSDLTRHVRIHTGERPYHCEMCGKCFARADYLSKHLTTHLHNSHSNRAAASTD